MNKLLLGIITLLIGGFAVAAYIADSNRPKPRAHANSEGMTHQLTVYKSATCGCCSNWVAYMRNKGYKVEAINTEDVESIKRQHSIPEDIYACHTTIVNGGEYFIEGHIPEESIAKLLENTPDIRGIGMAGMPAGSPGMPGAQEMPFEIMQLDQDKKLSVFEVI